MDLLKQVTRSFRKRSENPEQTFTPLAFYGAISQTAYFKAMGNVSKTKFKDVLMSNIDSDAENITPSPQQAAIQHAIEYVMRENGQTPDHIQSAKLAKQIVREINATDQALEELEKFGEIFMQTSATAEEYEEHRRLTDRIRQENQVSDGTDHLLFTHTF